MEMEQKKHDSSQDAMVLSRWWDRVQDLGHNLRHGAVFNLRQRGRRRLTTRIGQKRLVWFRVVHGKLLNRAAECEPTTRHMNSSRSKSVACPRHKGGHYYLVGWKAVVSHSGVYYRLCGPRFQHRYSRARDGAQKCIHPVSYTHLTLPTILRV